MDSKVTLVPKEAVVVVFMCMLLIPVIYSLRGGLAMGGLVFLLWPAGVFGIVAYINESAFDALSSAGGHLFLGWATYFLILFVGLRYRSWQAYRRWVIVCLFTFLLTWAGCGPAAETFGPCTNGC